jgi:hypothetical protein
LSDRFAQLLQLTSKRLSGRGRQLPEPQDDRLGHVDDERGSEALAHDITQFTTRATRRLREPPDLTSGQ